MTSIGERHRFEDRRRDRTIFRVIQRKIACPQFESARSGFADYAKDGETEEQLRTRVNRVILEDLEQKVLALRALHAKLRDVDAGESFAGVVARSRPV
ncbi:MAG: hypothetical protein ACLPQ4_03970 [Thermoplasmata archaeon]